MKRPREEKTADPQPTSKRTKNTVSDQQVVIYQRNRKAAIQTRTSPNGLYNLIKNLNEKQKEAVREIGFGSVLSLNVSKLPMKLARYLVERFDTNSTTLQFEKEYVSIDEEDVKLVLGIPSGPRIVEESPGVESDSNEYKDLLVAWKSRYGGTTPMVTKMPEIMLKDVEAGDDFKRDMVIYIVSSFLYGLQNKKAKFRVLKSLVNTSDIKNYNWCRYTVDGLIKCCDIWQENKTTHFCGPLTFLVLFYVDRMKFKLGNTADRLIPIISSWDTSKVLDRAKKEEEHGGFGTGRILPPPENEKETTETPECLLLLEGADNKKKDFVDDVTQAFTMMGSATLTFVELFVEAKRKNIEVGDLFKKACSGLKELFQNIQEDKIAQELQDKPSSSKSRLDSQEDDFFNRDDFIKAFDALDKSLTKAKDISMPSFDLGIDDHDDKQPENQTSTVHEVGVQKQQPAHQKQIYNDKKIITDEEAETEAEYAVNLITLASQAEKASTTQDNTECTTPPHIPQPENDEDKHLIDRILGDGDGDGSEEITIQPNKKHRITKLPSVLKSPYWNHMPEKKIRLSAKETLITDFALLDRMPEKNIHDDDNLFEYEMCYITRSMAKSMLPEEHIWAEFVDAWAYHLMFSCSKTRDIKPKRIFFSTLAHQQLMPLGNENVTKLEMQQRFFNRLQNELQLAQMDKQAFDADLVFFPICKSEHFYVICINTLSKTVDIIDNRLLPRGISMTNKYETVPTAIRLHFSNFIKQTNASNKYGDINKYSFKVLKMAWQHSSNDKDCGIFCMRHMETYKGQNTRDAWDNILMTSNTDSVIIETLRNKYLYTIIMSDINVLRDIVKAAASNLYKN